LATLKKTKKKNEDGKEFRNATVKVGDEAERVMQAGAVGRGRSDFICKHYMLLFPQLFWSHNFVLMIILA
jgi:hypothetical protein